MVELKYCHICKIQLDPYDTYEFKGGLTCGGCYSIVNKSSKLSNEEIKLKVIEERDRKQQEIDKKKQNISNFIIVTVPSIEGKKIEKYYNMITSELVIGTGVFSEIHASIMDIFGCDGAYSDKLKSLKEKVYIGLKNQAVSLGANAIIGAGSEYRGIGNMIMFSVSGTPVVVKDIKLEECFQENEK